MRELTRHVLREAVTQAAEWDLSVAVNLSLASCRCRSSRSTARS